MKYFLISSMAKSGSTWLQRICAAHPEMHCRAEDQFTKIWDDMTGMVGRYNALIDQRDRERDHQGVEAYDKNDTIALFFSMIRIALDKTPNGVAWSGVKDLTLSSKGFLIHFPESRVIQLLRDPRDMALSGFAHGRRIAAPETETPDRPNDDFILHCAESWAYQVQLIQAAHQEFPGRNLTVRYEDLLDDFPAAAGRIFGFFDVARDDATLSAIQAATAFKALSGGRDSGETDPDSFFRSGKAGEWRSVLTPTQIDIVRETCGDQMAELGYA